MQLNIKILYKTVEIFIYLITICFPSWISFQREVAVSVLLLINPESVMMFNSKYTICSYFHINPRALTMPMNWMKVQESAHRLKPLFAKITIWLKNTLWIFNMWKTYKIKKKKGNDVTKMATYVIPDFAPPHKKNN